MKRVADLFVALYLASAVSGPDKGAGILQQAHNLRLWQLRIALVVWTGRPTVSDLQIYTTHAGASRQSQ